MNDNAAVLSLRGDEHLSLADRAYLALREQIVTLRLKPGQPIREDDLMADLGVGRAPLRDAIRRLKLDHLVAITPRRGTFVREIRVTDFPRLAELRLELEPFVSQLAATRLGDDERALADAIGAELVALDDPPQSETLLALYYRAHQVIYQASGNILLTEMVDRALHLHLRVCFQIRNRLGDQLRALVADHQRVLAAVCRGDAERAGELAQQHVREADAVIRSAL